MTSHARFPERERRVAGAPSVDPLSPAAQIIAAASRERPADAVLRETLRRRSDLSAEDRRAISRAVFSYYRWLGWLDTKRPLLSQLKYALELANAFADRPNSFSDEKLVRRSIAPWVHEHCGVSPAWARAIQAEPRLWLRAKRGRGSVLARKLGECWIPGARALADAIAYQGSEDLFRSREFHAGEFEIQDVASQAVGLICDPKPGEVWWDACAGEGGKTLHLSDLMANKGLIWASDRAGWRLRQLKRRAGRAGCFNYRAAVWDGGSNLPTRTRFDGVLLDAPCTGVGTWQRNPQARWTTTPADVAELAAVQLNLLAHTAPAVKPGGRLIYAVCTLTRAETGEVARIFVERFPEFEPASIRSPWEEIHQTPYLGLWPQDTGGNGMFLAAWQRKPTSG